MYRIKERLTALGLTIAVAESSAGGVISAYLTSASGASQFFKGGLVAYDNESKTRLLGVDQGRLDVVGAVSADVALAMARGVREVFGADIGFAETGILGPGGGSQIKPVGTVFFAVSGPKQEAFFARTFKGDRSDIRRALLKTSASAIDDWLSGLSGVNRRSKGWRRR